MSLASNPRTVSRSSPGAAVNFVGAMEKRSRDGELTGITVWYRCDEIRSLHVHWAARKIEAVS